MSESNFTVHEVPVLDTGIGQSLGFEDDQALVAAVEAERATYPPEVREALEEYDRRLDRAFLFGTA
jgi:hypothetical protein